MGAEEWATLWFYAEQVMERTLKRLGLPPIIFVKNEKADQLARQMYENIANKYFEKHPNATRMAQTIFQRHSGDTSSNSSVNTNASSSGNGDGYDDNKNENENEEEDDDQDSFTNAFKNMDEVDLESTNSSTSSK